MTGSVSYNEPAQWNKVNFFFFKFFNQSQAKRRHYWNEAPRMNIHSNNSRQTSERLMSLDVICFLFCVRRRMLRLSRFVCINRPLFLCVPSAGNKCHAEPINASAAIYWVMYSILFVVCFRIRAVRRGKLLNICQKSEKREYFVSSTVDFPGFHASTFLTFTGQPTNQLEENNNKMMFQLEHHFKNFTQLFPLINPTR